MRSAIGLHALTRGNPLFVSELLRHGAEGVPRGVQDLVLARFARLGAAAQAVVRLASTVPTRIEGALVEALLRAARGGRRRVPELGLLNAGDGGFFFRHELVRVAIEASLSPPTARALHADVLRALSQPGHAARRRSRGACITPCARATRARSRRSRPRPRARPEQRGAHGEAAAHYRTALAHGDARRRVRRVAGRVRARVPADGQLDDAIAAHEQLSTGTASIPTRGARPST